MNGQGTKFLPRNGQKQVGEFKDGKPWTIIAYNRYGTIILKTLNGRLIQGEWE